MAVIAVPSGGRSPEQITCARLGAATRSESNASDTAIERNFLPIWPFPTSFAAGAAEHPQSRPQPPGAAPCFDHAATANAPRRANLLLLDERNFSRSSDHFTDGQTPEPPRDLKGGLPPFPPSNEGGRG